VSGRPPDYIAYMSAEGQAGQRRVTLYPAYLTVKSLSGAPHPAGMARYTSV